MGSSSRSSRGSRGQASTGQMIESLRNHTINTLTELCRIERVAMASEGEEMNAFQGPLAVAWDYYVNSNQLLLELRGLTRNYPASSSLVEEAKRLVSADPGSGQSWNLAWLCLVKIRDAGLIASCAQAEAQKPEMWGGRYPSLEEAEQLTQCFVCEWTQAVDKMLRHWRAAPIWY